MAKVGRKVGKPKTGGRRKGSVNKVTADIRKLAGEHGEAMVEELARLALKSESEQVRVAAIREMLDRAYGKPLARQDVLFKDRTPRDGMELSMIERARGVGHVLMEAKRLEGQSETDESVDDSPSPCAKDFYYNLPENRSNGEESND